jgi:hypothetical protein
MNQLNGFALPFDVALGDAIHITITSRPRTDNIEMVQGDPAPYCVQCHG